MSIPSTNTTKPVDATDTRIPNTSTRPITSRSFLIFLLNFSDLVMSFSLCHACTVKRLSPFFFPRLRKVLIVNTSSSITQFVQSSSISTWVEPNGFHTGISIYNTPSRSKVPLKTSHPNLLTWYICGPTVYDSAHIGHAMCYVKCDIIRRILENIFQLNVVQVMGITDIDDKIISKAKASNISVRAVTQKYEEEFIRDMKNLNILPPVLYSRVSDHMPQILSFIQQIINNGYAYALDDGTVYFDLEAFGKHGKLSRIPEDQHTPPSIDSRKKFKHDFALWKGAKEGEPSWISPWGAGRPGWHIECSAMACHIFGHCLDLHSGGIDLLFPHHENEETQCCAHHRIDQWCNYWIHTGHLFLKDQNKMSKSLRNTVSIEKFLTDHSSNIFRFFCLLTHKQDVEYSDTTLFQAENYSRKIQSFLQDSQAYIHSQISCGPLDDTLLLQKLSEVKMGVREALADNFDTIQALLLVSELIAECSKELRKEAKPVSVSSSLSTVAAINNYILQLFTDLGLNYTRSSDAGSKLPHAMTAMLKFRKSVRDFALLQDSQSSEITRSKEEKESLRQDRVPLLKACDDLRKDLRDDCINIKDVIDFSTWGHVEEYNDKSEKTKPPKSQPKTEEKEKR